jgi:asparagine synthase (glutamine-hydrolysing)
MCGIGGFFGQRVADEAIVSAMVSSLANRGPDAQHVVRFGADFARTEAPSPNALVHTRLSIIDPRPEADQPMANEAGDIWICYNGEVYGWEADARALQAEGRVFRTRADTEFILHGYEAWGTGVLDRLRGMFAFAILDLRKRRVFVARDRIGKKPLVYFHENGEFAFASTVRGLLPYIPAEKRGLSSEGIDAFLTHRYIPAPRTVLAHARRLPNGHYLEFDLGSRELRETRYWHPKPEGRDLLATLDESVELRTVADRPVGIYLSGGIDSTVIATRLAALGHTRLAAFTVAFPGSALDESQDAARTAAMLGLPHHPVEVPTTIHDDFARIVRDLDEPFADPSAFPMWYLSRETTRHVKVVLAGDGGDELFAGYKRYGAHLRTRWRRGLSAGFGGWAPAIESPKAHRLAGELAASWEDAYALRFSGMDPGQRTFLQPRLATLRPTYWRAPDVGTEKPLETLLAIDMANYLPEYILRKGDLTTMAHGLELRAPLLDAKLYEAVLAMPRAERFTRPGKLALAPACAPCRELGLFDAKKRGFNPPLGRWLHDDLAERLDGLGGRLEHASAGQIDARSADAFIAAYRAGRERLAENVLQLAVLEESLSQLATDGSPRAD